MVPNLRRFLALGLAVSLIGLTACSSGSGTATVEGVVTVDQKPLKYGLIKFIPIDGKSQSADAVIKDGQYRAEVPVGDKRVEISASKVIGKRKMYDTPDAPTVDDVVELLPSRYNTSTELKYTVQSGSQTKNFECQSK